MMLTDIAVNAKKINLIEYLNFNPKDVLEYKLPNLISKIKENSNPENYQIKIYHLQDGVDLLYFEGELTEAVRIISADLNNPYLILFNFKKFEYKSDFKDPNTENFEFEELDLELNKDNSYKFACINFSYNAIKSIFSENFISLGLFKYNRQSDSSNCGYIFIDEIYSQVGNELLEIFFNSKPIKQDRISDFFSFKVYEILYKTILLCTTYNQNSKNKIRFSNSDITRIKKAMELLISDLENAPTISELAKIVSLNSSKLKAGFKSLYNSTIYGYLSNYRLQIAHEMIMYKGTNITEAATSIGYSSLSKFTIAFRKKYGMNPSSLLKIRDNSALRKVG